MVTHILAKMGDPFLRSNWPSMLRFI